MKRLIPFCFVLVLALAFTFTACGDESAENTSDSASADEQVVYQDDNLTATFYGIDDVAGQVGMKFTLENNSDHEITVLPMNSSINSVSVQFVSGTLATIQPDKSFNQVWMANPEVIGVSDSSEVNDIEFTIHYDEVDTAPVRINVDAYR